MVANAALDMAKHLAEEHREGDPAVQRVLWFPNGSVVHLVVVTEDSVSNDDGALHPFYYRAAPDHGLPLPSGVALIRPSELGKLKLPDGWPAWENAQDI